MCGEKLKQTEYMFKSNVAEYLPEVKVH